MELNRREFSASLGLATALPAAATSGHAIAPIVAELRALRVFAENTHPRGTNAREAPDWQRQWHNLERQAAGMGAGQLFIAMRRALGWFQDGHTTVLPIAISGTPATPTGRALAATLPIKVAVFDDGAWVTAANADTMHLRGRKIGRIGALTSARLIQELARGWPGNLAWAQRWAAAHFTSPALLHGLGAISHPDATVGIEADGAVATLSARNEWPDLEELPRQPGPIETMRLAAGAGNFVRDLADRQALYLSIDDMADGEGKPFAAFESEVAARFEQPGATRLVVDLRRNGGGDNFLCEPLRRRIVRSRFNMPGSLYVLAGPQTFSAAQNFVNRIERDCYALFVGSPTGGAPNHHGDAKPFVGKASGLTAIIASVPWFDSYPIDRRAAIYPDIAVPDRFADWLAGRDAALEAALSHRLEPEAKAAMAAAMGTYAFDRPSQRVQWQPFWRA